MTKFRVQQIDHVELFVPDRYEAAKWYEQALGLEIARDYEFWAKDPGGPLMIMTADGATKGSRWEYRGSIACRSSGQYGFVVRVLPRHGDLPHPFEPGLVSWGA